MLRSDEQRAENGSRHEVENLDAMLDACVDCIKVLHIDGTLLKMNRSGCLALGLPLDDSYVGVKWLDFMPPDVRPRGRRALRAAQEGRTSSFTGRTEQPGQKTIHWHNILTPVLDDDGQAISILCVSRDVTRQIEAEKKLRLASDFDVLTNLPNRRYFERHTTRCLKALAKTDNRPGALRLGVLIIDVDHFKDINDLFGHEAGDLVLKSVAERFAARLNPGEFAGRLGGDEFAVVIKEIADGEALDEVAERMRGALDEPIFYEGHRLTVSFSIGGALSSPDRQNVSSLLKAGDLALYEVKLDGRNGYALYRDEDGSAKVKRRGQAADRRATRL